MPTALPALCAASPATGSSKLPTVPGTRSFTTERSWEYIFQPLVLLQGWEPAAEFLHGCKHSFSSSSWSMVSCAHAGNGQLQLHLCWHCGAVNSGESIPVPLETSLQRLCL